MRHSSFTAPNKPQHFYSHTYCTATLDNSCGQNVWLNLIFRLQKKKEKEQEAELEQKIKQLQDVNIKNPTEETQIKLREYKLKLNATIDKHTQFLIHRLRQNEFHHSNNSSKYLANQIKQNK